MIPFFPEPFSPLSGGRVSGKTSIFISISIYIALSICVSVCIYICTCISISIGDQSLRLVTFGHQWFLCFLPLSISLSLSVFLSVSISIPLSLSAPSGPIFCSSASFFGSVVFSSPPRWFRFPLPGNEGRHHQEPARAPFFLQKGPSCKTSHRDILQFTPRKCALRKESFAHCDGRPKALPLESATFYKRWTKILCSRYNNLLPRAITMVSLILGAYQKPGRHLRSPSSGQQKGPETSLPGLSF